MSELGPIHGEVKDATVANYAVADLVRETFDGRVVVEAFAVVRDHYPLISESEWEGGNVVRLFLSEYAAVSLADRLNKWAKSLNIAPYRLGSGAGAVYLASGDVSLSTLCSGAIRSGGGALPSGPRMSTVQSGEVYTTPYFYAGDSGGTHSFQGLNPPEPVKLTTPDDPDYVHTHGSVTYVVRRVSLELCP